MTTTKLPNPRPTSAKIGQLRELATAVEAITDTIDRFLDDDLPTEWATFMTHALSQTGLKTSSRYDFADLSHGYYPAITPGAAGITYSGEVHYQGCGSETHSYTIPWDFIDPATRTAAEEQTLADLREEKVEKDAEVAANAARQAEHQRKEQEKQLTRLAESLGKKVIDA